MAVIFDRVPRHELGTKFTHYGWLHCPLVPVYVSNLGEDDMEIVVANDVPDFIEPVARFLFAVSDALVEFLIPEYEPRTVLKVLGEIPPQE